MKKNNKMPTIAILVSMSIMLCSCSNSDGTSTSTSTTHAPASRVEHAPATYEKNITGSDVYNNGWYYESLDIHRNVEVRNYEPNKGVTWKVYLSEESLSEEEMEKLKEREPDIINSGEFNASQYDWIYVYCDVNSTNSPAPTSDMLKISYQTQ